MLWSGIRTWIWVCWSYLAKETSWWCKVGFIAYPCDGRALGCLPTYLVVVFRSSRGKVSWRESDCQPFHLETGTSPLSPGSLGSSLHTRQWMVNKTCTFNNHDWARGAFRLNLSFFLSLCVCVCRCFVMDLVMSPKFWCVNKVGRSWRMYRTDRWHPHTSCEVADVELGSCI